MMAQGSLTKLYSDFLVAPRKDVLHAQAGLHYIGSTGSSFQSNDGIINHFTKEAKWYKKKEQKVLSSVEGGNSVVVEVATVVEFTNGGGVLLPGLDDNFVTDQTVTFPMVHIVQFEDGLIKQIRQYWDQACILQQINIIGKSGRNWPIRKGEDQVKLVKSSINSVAETALAASESGASRPSSKGSNFSNRESIQLFAPRDPDEEAPPVIAPRAGQKPPGRQLHEIIGEEDDEPTAVQTPKAGAQNAPRRTFFIGQEIDEANSTPDRKVRVHENKFKHFDLEINPEKDAEVPKPIPPKRMSVYSKPGPSWDFADFSTPEKRPGKTSIRNERTMTWSDDEDTSPVKPQQPGKPLPRKGLGSQFDIVDETPKKAGQPARESHLRKDQETHFTLTDKSPNQPNETPADVPAARQTVLKGMEANWSNSSPLGEAKPVPNFSGIATAGDGMGGKKGSSRLWDFEDETPKKANGGVGIYKTAGNGMGGRKGVSNDWIFNGEDESASAPVARKIYNTAGDGMGGRKAQGGERHWEFEEEFDAEPAPTTRKIYNTAGDGMGGRKAQGGERHWGFEEEFDAEPAPATRKIYNTAGDGTGARKAQGGERHWGFGDDQEDVVEQPPKKENAPMRGQSKSTSDFWDF